jgi:hypothetical protein
VFHEALEKYRAEMVHLPRSCVGASLPATGPEGVFSARPEVFRLPAVLSATRVESKGAQETQKHVFFLENFLDNLQRKFQLGNGVKRR